MRSVWEVGPDGLSSLPASNGRMAFTGDADPFHLDRFVEAQSSTYGQARAELAGGQKRSHWMWFIFPQIQGLGSSSMARRYAITGLAEARAYLAHPVLGPRLRECTALLNGIVGRHTRGHSRLPPTISSSIRASRSLHERHPRRKTAFSYPRLTDISTADRTRRRLRGCNSAASLWCVSWQHIQTQEFFRS